MDNSPLPQIGVQKQQNIIDTNAKSDKESNIAVLHEKRKGVKAESVVADATLLHGFFRSLVQSQVALDLELTAARTEFIKQYISPLNNKHVPLFTQEIRSALISRLAGEIKSKTVGFGRSLELFTDLVRNFRDCSVTPPIIMATYLQFQNLWLSAKQSVPFLIIQEELFKRWKVIPYQLIRQFLTNFQLLQRLQAVPISEFLYFLTGILFENRIQQTCEYYLLFKQNRKSSEEDSKLLDTFEYEQLLPRITKKDQLFTDYVLRLLQKDEQIITKVFECIQKNQSEKLINLTRRDIHDHPKILHSVMKKHYRDIVRRFPQWYVVEDKISFNSKFVEWFANSLLKPFRRQQDSDSDAEKGKMEIQTQVEAKQIAESLLYRAKIIHELKGTEIKNPLYEKDDFIPAECILQESANKSTFCKDDYLQIEDSARIQVIDQIDSNFYKARQTILHSNYIGFDSQFWATATKYQEGGVSIIQLATEHDYYIFDYYRLRHCEEFNGFLIDLMEDERIVKVGHTVSSDLQFLYQNFAKKMNIRSMVDLTHLLKRYYPQYTFSSLAFMTEKFLNKKMCKYEQRGNWNRRPLKKTQLYYAALDASICLLIYSKMRSEIEEIQIATEIITENIHSEIKEIKGEGKAGKEQLKRGEGQFDFVKFEQYVKDPIFLIDNMLKRLCSTMRNCGIDAEFIAIKDYELAIGQAKKQKRILITRDSKLLLKRYAHIPIYLLKERNDTDLMFAQLKKVFNINLGNYQTLSRCVKCNNPEIVVIDAEQARKEVNFAYQDSAITVFWRCSKCRQIYWEGGQFQKAKRKFDALRK